MAAKPVVLTNTIGFRLTAEEHAEIATFLQRSGQTQSDFVRNAVLGKVRGATAFAELLPSLAASIEREVLETRKTVELQSAIIRTLVGASIVQVARTVNYGSRPKEEVDRLIDADIMHALETGPVVVNACIQQHPDLQGGEH